MAIQYPSKIDDNTSLPDAIDNITPVKADVVNRLKAAILAIENELGTKPSGISATVKARIAAIETSVNSLDIIQLSQDLGGTLSSPKVVGLQGKPVSSAVPTANQALVFNGLAWVPQTISGGGGSITFGGDLSGTSSTQTVIGLQGRGFVSTAPNNGEGIVWDSGTNKWKPGSVAGLSAIIYKPGGVSTSTTVTTWAEVVARINAANGLLDVYIDGSLAVPTVTSNVDCQGRTRFIGIERYVIGGSNFTQLVVPDGFIITNPASFYGLLLSCTGNSVIIALTITSAQTTFECTSIFMSAANNTPIITMAVNDATIRFVRSTVFANLAGAAAVINTGSGASLYVTVQLIEGQPFASLPTLAFIGDSQLYVQTDGSAFLPVQSLYTGIQGETHLLKTQNDTTANRPVPGPSGGPTDGQMYFDTTLGKPIWYLGGSWVDATGTVV